MKVKELKQLLVNWYDETEIVYSGHDHQYFPIGYPFEIQVEKTYWNEYYDTNGDLDKDSTLVNVLVIND